MDAIAVGSRVRAFDFEDRDLDGPHACYIEGDVVGVDTAAHRYEIRVSRSVFGGVIDLDRVGRTVTPPLNGIPTLLGKTTNYVELIAPAEVPATEASG